MRRVGDHERLVDELRDAVEHVERIDVVAADDRLGGVEGEPTREHPEAVEDRAFAFVEQVVAPVDRLAQRLVTFHRGAAPAGEQPEPLVETRRDLLRGSSSASAPPRARSRAGSRRADRQSCATVAAVSASSIERTAGLRGPLGEERRPHRRRRISSVVASSPGSGSDRTIIMRSPRTPSPSRPVASTVTPGHDPHDRLDELRGGVEEMLAVVEHHQQLLRLCSAATRLSAIDCPGRCCTPSASATTSGTWPGSLNGPNSHSHTPSPKRGSSSAARLHRETGLAHATHTDEGDHPTSVRTPR